MIKCLEEDFKVSAFTRNTVRLDWIEHPNLIKISGDIHSNRDLDLALKDHDVVIIALGDGAKGKIRTIGTENIIRSMKRNGINNLICMSTMGIGESAKYLNFFWKYIMFGFFLKKAFKDHIQQEKIVQNSGLNYSIVRPSAFTEDHPTGFRILQDHYKGKLKLKISLQEIADFVSGLIENKDFNKECYTISS